MSKKKKTNKNGQQFEKFSNFLALRPCLVVRD